MKILFFDHSPVLGGGEMAILEIIEELNSYEKVLVVPEGSEVIEYAQAKGIKVLPLFIPERLLQVKRETIFPLREFWSFLNTTFRFSRLLSKEYPDLVYTNSQKAHLIGLLAARLIGIPAICHFRDIIFENPKSNPKLNSIWLRSIILLEYLLAKKVVVVSKAVAEQFPQKNKVKVIYGGIDKVENTDEKVENKKEYVIGMACQLSPWKGVEYFIASASIIVKKIPNVQFLIAGAPIFGHIDYADKLSNLIKEKKLVDKVTFVGWIKDPVRFISGLDILVHCSVKPEPFGRVIIEAGMAGKPVIATNVGAPPEILTEETGILVPPRDPSAIASAVITLLSDEEKRKKMGEKAREWTMKHFSKEKMMVEINKLINEVIRR